MHLHLDRRIKIQLVIFTVIALVAVAMMSLYFMKLPAMLFGVGRYTVKMELPQAAGLYGTANVRQPYPVGFQSRGAQPIGDRRNVRRIAAPQRRLAAAEGRRRDCAG